ncbi:HNH endonuclease family protein [Chryseobacterium vrystaatense]|uniref:HNH endonuclease n=1 Tax=Chryseobacterium vrystaatense TaxID=307480 RepID=A0A1M5IIH0_9FLAO|nr:HNH endonuclease domain-containing protein [Chryseobacterium vrystaatense]SHG27700.1 HNH endonuclease [Chryseobacterium vrystaatense]
MSYLHFQDKDPSLESQWRSIILFGKNSATYKFAFAKSLLDLVSLEKTTVSLQDLAPDYVQNILVHLKRNDKQGNSQSSTFLNACREFNDGKMDYDRLLTITVQHGFTNVVDAFHNVNSAPVKDAFYHKDYNGGVKNIVITDHLLSLKESQQFINFNQEVEARWNLVETAWNLEINPNLLEVQYDKELSMLFLENYMMKRKDITSARDSLNGYQKGKCFYSFQNISIKSGDDLLCHVDHFFPHVHKIELGKNGAHINGIWNLVLTEKTINLDKKAQIPEIKYLERLYKRNEFYIASKHPLGETIINQTGKTQVERKRFLQKQYDLSVNLSIQKWKPNIELDPLF